MSRHEVRLVDSGESYACDASESLLAGMARLGRRGIPVGCRSGGCGVCRIAVVSGTVEHGRMSRDHVSAEDEERGWLLACRAYPRSDVDVRVLGLKRNVSTTTNTTQPPGLGAATQGEPAWR